MYTPKQSPHFLLRDSIPSPKIPQCALLTRATGLHHPGQPLTYFPSLEMTSVLKKRLGHYILKGDCLLLPSYHHRNENKP